MEAKKGKRSKKLGMPPGSLVYVGERKAASTVITIIDYMGEHFEERELVSADECSRYKSTGTTTWINVDGVHDPAIIQSLGGQFGLHPLVLEDIVNTDQRPKHEDMGEYLYVVAKMLYFDDKKSIIAEQVSFVLGNGYLISFQEQERAGDVFNFVRERIRSGKGKVRESGPDYLLYSLMDAIVDHYFVIMEEEGERIDQLENSLVTDPEPNILQKLYRLKRTMLSLRRSIWPLREVISGFSRRESSLIKDSTLVYIQDLYGHVVQIIDTIETSREALSSMLDIYLSGVSNRLNTVMKFLTLVATIFMPLTFIAGIYGMNFKYMPELEWRYGYPAVLAIMLLVGAGMVMYFRQKKWI